MVEDTLSVLAAVGVIYVGYRFFFGGSSSAVPAGGPPVMGQGILRGVNEGMVDSVASAFPDLPRANILWDLSKTRSVESTVERILSVGTLPAPPANLFPAPAPVAPRTQPTFASSATTSAVSKPAPTLIERFNLSSRVPPTPSLKGKERAVDVDGSISGSASVGTNAAKWEATAAEREASLKARKEEMVLAARRKLLEKQAAAKMKADASA